MDLSNTAGNFAVGIARMTAVAIRRDGPVFGHRDARCIRRLPVPRAWEQRARGEEGRMPWRKNCKNSFPMTPFAKRAFRYELTRVADRPLLEAKCLNCGQQTVVSTYDGSLQRWERVPSWSRAIPTVWKQTKAVCNRAGQRAESDACFHGNRDPAHWRKTSLTLRPEKAVRSVLNRGPRILELASAAENSKSRNQNPKNRGITRECGRSLA